MIVFDLDLCIADNRHRLQLIDPLQEYPFDGIPIIPDINVNLLEKEGGVLKNFQVKTWKPNWTAYWDACDKDEPFNMTLWLMFQISKPYEIWSGRPELSRKITEEWLCERMHRSEMPNLKLRPEDETCPDEVLFERWLDEYIEGPSDAMPRTKLMYDLVNAPLQNEIEMAFSGNPAVIEMWKRRGVTCFQVHV